MGMSGLGGPPKPRLVLNVGVTGHRHDDLIGRDLRAIGETVAKVLERLRSVVEKVERTPGPWFDSRTAVLRLFSRLADGSDLMVAEIAVQQGWELHCPLPFGREEYAASVAPEWQPRYWQMVEVAKGILELDGEPPSGGGSHMRDEVFFESRRMVLRQCDVLIAIWDPEERPSQVWGTTRLVHEARHDDLLVVHIDPKKPTEYHVDTREERAAISLGADETLGDLVRALLLPSAGTESPYEEFLAESPRRWAFGFTWSMFRNLLLGQAPGIPSVRVSGELDRALAGAGALWKADPPLPARVRQAIDEALVRPFVWTDTLAERYANLTRSSIVLNYLMASGAVAMALTPYAVGWTDEHHPLHAWAAIWVVIELTLIVGIVLNTRIGNGRRWHERWMDYRLLAERLRLQRTLAPLGRITPNTRRPAHLSFGDIRNTWMGWYFRAMVRDLGMIPGRYDAGYVQAACAVMMRILRHPADGQIEWHTVNARRVHIVDHRLHALGTVLFVITGIACVVHLFAHWPWLTLVAATFPALGAAMAAIGTHLQLDRIAKHSAAMADRLGRLSADLKDSPSKSVAVGNPCEEIVECMTTEVLDWRSLFRGTIFLP